jgi:GAF domain-containing protein
MPDRWGHYVRDTYRNVQIVDPVVGSLRIAAQAGFSDEFLEYFAIVDGDTCACGRAARQLAQIVVTDVNTDPGLAPLREIAAHRDTGRRSRHL